MARKYAENYGLLSFAGSDSHGKESHGHRGGMCCETLIVDERDFTKKVLSGQLQTFHKTIAPFSDNNIEE